MMEAYPISEKKRLWGFSNSNGNVAVKVAQNNPGIAGNSAHMLRFFAILKMLISPIYRAQKYVLYETDDDSTLPTFNRHPTIQIATYDGSSAIPDIVAEVIDPDPGETMTVIFIGRKVVGYVRAAFKDVDIPALKSTVSVAAGEAFFYDVFIFPEYRGMGLYVYLLTTAARHYLRKGFGRLVIGVLEENAKAKNGIERAGFRVFQISKFYRILGLNLFRTISRPRGKTSDTYGSSNGRH